MEKIYGPSVYTWNRNFDPNKLADYEVACNSRAMQVMHRYLIGEIVALQKKHQELLVLDAGCGYARWDLYLKRKGIKCIGVDQNEAVITQVKQFDPELPVKVADLRKLPFESNYFDFVFSFGVLEHFEEGMDQALAEIGRVLKPGGRLLLTVPYVNWLKWLTKPLRFVRHVLNSKKYKSFREYRFNKQELTNILARNKFKIVKADVSDNTGVGLWEDFSFLRRPWIFRLNSTGETICRLLNSVSPWITTWGILVIGENNK